MSPLQGLLVWLSGFVVVFLLGFQSRNAMAGRYARCAATSFLIALCQVVSVRATMADPWLTAVLIGTSGAAGICTAIWVNLNVLKLKAVS